MAVVHAYDVSLRASKSSLLLNMILRRRISCSKLENEVYDMYKKMVAAKYDYEQAQEQLEKVQQKGN